MNLWNDPNRWVDADMERNDTLRLAGRMALLALVITVLAVCAGLAVFGG